MCHRVRCRVQTASHDGSILMAASQAIGSPLRNHLYAGIVHVPEYGVRAKRGDFEPLISEDLFYRVQSVLSGRVPITTRQQRLHPDFALRAFVRCESCGRGGSPASCAL